MKVFKSILLVLCLYIYLYNPIFQLIGFGLIKFLLVLSILYLIFNKRFKLIFKYLKIELLFTCLLIVYTLPVIFGDGTAIQTPYAHFLWFAESIIIPVFILFLFIDIFEKYSWEAIIVPFGFLASLITLYLVINPSINSWIRDSVIHDPLDTTLSDWSLRGFTLAESSSYAYGVMQGLMFAFCLLSLKKSNLYAIPIIPILISILFNARIGFAVVILAVILFIVSRRLKFKYVIISAVIVLCGSIFYNNSKFVTNNSDSLEWGLSFFEDTFSFVSGGDTSNSNYEVLTDTMIFFPRTIWGIIFGEGRSVYGLEGQGSDIGFINQIFIGGISYVLIMTFFLLYMFKRNLRYATDKLYPILFVCTIIIANIKGSAFFLPNGFFRLFTLYYIYCIFIQEGLISKQSSMENEESD